MGEGQGAGESKDIQCVCLDFLVHLVLILILPQCPGFGLKEAVILLPACSRWPRGSAGAKAAVQDQPGWAKGPVSDPSLSQWVKCL